MEECMPTKPKKLTVHFSSELKVVEARKKAEKAHEVCTDNTDENRAAWKIALEWLSPRTLDSSPGRSTVAQILTLRRIIEVVKANNLPAITAFIDFIFKKTFDSIHKSQDDIVILSDTKKQAEELFLRVEQEYSRVGLCLNGPKTKYLANNTANHSHYSRDLGCVRAER
ncbi:hypothetical protein ElyMa_006961100 [Elysia marginata]|uniref:Reverse transcriptase domain-containing protein n=1 Tax=Elysia marginata TaxID=1093978 RepID=A0AAV4JK90_9GAST|nr:hypothetical protein ElyMa_006961100 [Elysia marginata]